jgi:hypothetical protein
MAPDDLASGDLASGSGTGLPDVEGHERSEGGLDVSTSLGWQPIDLDVSVELSPLDLSLKLGPVSLGIATGDAVGSAIITAGESVFGEVAEPALETFVNGVVDTLGELSEPLHNLLDGSIVPSGILGFADVGRLATSFEVVGSSGAYTDYDVALRTDGANGSSGSSILAGVADHQVDAQIAWHASATAAELAVTPAPLHSVADEMLRGTELVL